MGQVTLTPEQIPEVKEPMPVMELSIRQWHLTILLKILSGELHQTDNSRRLEMVEEGVAYDNNKVIAFVNPKTGESMVFPLLDGLKPGQGLSNRAKCYIGKGSHRYIVISRRHDEYGSPHSHNPDRLESF